MKKSSKMHKPNGIAFWTGSAALLDCFISTPITKQILKKTKFKQTYMSLNAIVGMTILGIGALGRYVFNKIDEKKATKLGDFAYKMFNGRNSLEK